MSGPASNLKKARRPWLTAAIIAGTVVGVSGLGVGAVALAQSVGSTPEVVVETPVSAPEPKSLANVDPTAAFTFSTSDLTIAVDASGSVDEDGEIVEFAWDFGDGATASEVVTSHAYASAGTYTVTLSVTDDRGGVVTAAQQVSVTAPAPPPPAPPAPAGPIRCPAGSSANSSDGYNDTSCFPNICFTIPVPDPAHPECDVAFRP